MISASDTVCSDTVCSDTVCSDTTFSGMASCDSISRWSLSSAVIVIGPCTESTGSMSSVRSSGGTTTPR